MATINISKIGNHTVDFSKEQNHNAEEIKDLIKLLATNKNNVICYFGKIRGTFENLPENVVLWDIVKNELYASSKQGKFEKLPNLQNLFLINSSINFFGGKDDPYTLKTFDLVSNAKNITFYFVDSLLGFHTELDISKREWKDKYLDLNLKVPQQIVKAITHYYDIDSALKKIQKTKRANKSPIPYFTKDSIHHFPMYKWHYLLQPEKSIKESPEFDLSFGGNPRHKLRIQALDDFLMTQSKVRVEMYGSCKPDDFINQQNNGKTVTFHGTVTFNELLENYSNSVATVLLADLDSDKMFTGRIGHAPLAGTVLLVEESCDPKHLLFPHMNVYFKTKEELEELTLMLKNDPASRKKVIEQQRECVKYTWQELREFFENIILS